MNDWIGKLKQVIDETPKIRTRGSDVSDEMKKFTLKTLAWRNKLGDKPKIPPRYTSQNTELSVLDEGLLILNQEIEAVEHIPYTSFWKSILWQNDMWPYKIPEISNNVLIGRDLFFTWYHDKTPIVSISSDATCGKLCNPEGAVTLDSKSPDAGFVQYVTPYNDPELFFVFIQNPFGWNRTFAAVFDPQNPALKYSAFYAFENQGMLGVFRILDTVYETGFNFGPPDDKFVDDSTSFNYKNLPVMTSFPVKNVNNAMEMTPRIPLGTEFKGSFTINSNKTLGNFEFVDEKILYYLYDNIEVFMEDYLFLFNSSQKRFVAVCRHKSIPIPKNFVVSSLEEGTKLGQGTLESERFMFKYQFYFGGSGYFAAERRLNEPSMITESMIM